MRQYRESKIHTEKRGKRERDRKHFEEMSKKFGENYKAIDPRSSVNLKKNKHEKTTRIKTHHS